MNTDMEKLALASKMLMDAVGDSIIGINLVGSTGDFKRTLEVHMPEIDHRDVFKRAKYVERDVGMWPFEREVIQGNVRYFCLTHSDKERHEDHEYLRA